MIQGGQISAPNNNWENETLRVRRPKTVIRRGNLTPRIKGYQRFIAPIGVELARRITLQRCQVHKGRNITDRLDESLHAGVRKVLRQAWQQDDAAKAERLLRNLARRLEHDAPGVSGSILEGLDEILTVIRLGLPPQLRHSLACTNAIENAIGTVRTVQRNVKRWRNAEMALRWTAAGLLEAQKTFRRLKAYRQLPVLDAALREAVRKAGAKSVIEDIEVAA